MIERRDSTSETGGSGQPNIVLTPDEKKVFGQLFQAADNENLGVVTGELAVKFFEKSGLSPRILGEIWGIADTENRGLLTKFGFSVALRLIGQAQNGQHPRPELAQQPGPLPRFEGVTIVYPSPPTTSSPPPPPPPVTTVIGPQPTGPSAMIRVPPLMPQDVDRFTALFEKSGAVDSLLQGSIARDIFQRSRLPNPILIQIWNLADRQGRGALGCVEFVVAMHLITCCKNGALPTLPQILPPGLYDAASGRPPARSGPDRRQTARAMPPVPPIPKQFSGPQAQRAQSPLSRNFTPQVPQNANAIQRDLTGGSGWAVSPADKQRFDAVFLTVDKANRGVITGDEAVPFFSNSGLPEDVLAQIWDLADINKAGQLNRDEFAIAMYLIVQQRSNPGVLLPETLPLNLIPPSMRQQRQISGPIPATESSPFDPVPPPPPPPPPPPAKSAADDLFGLDSFGSGAQPSAGSALTASAGPFDSDVFGASKEASANLTGSHTSVPPSGSTLYSRPPPAFIPSSSFGQSIMPSTASGSNQSRGFAPQDRGQDMDDLLGDADPEVSKKLTNETTEIANLNNQAATLTKQTQDLNIKRASAETDLSSITLEKQQIEAQLVQLRSAYEKEAAHVKQIEEQLALSRKDTAQIKQEYQGTEAEYSQLQYRLQEALSQFEADKRESESLKERMNAVSAESRLLKEELEKLQSQARREKGMIAINKKQVEKSEQERDKLKNGVDEATRSSVTSPVPPASPTLSQGSISTNPFYRKSPPVAESPYPSSFGPVKPSNPAMDDVFGPPFSSSPPPTSFSQKPGAEVSTSLPSASESGLGDRSTPPTSHPPSEAPPPAVGVQLTSAFLPLPISRADSVTSSVQVNPSASVRGDAESSLPDTSTNWMGSNTADTPTREREGSVKPDERRSSFSVKSDAGTDASGKVPFPLFDRRNDSPFSPVEKNSTGTTSGGDENKPKLTKSDSIQSFGNIIPNPFPNVENSAPIKPTATGESTMSNKSRVSNMSRTTFTSDPFTLSKDESRAGSSKDFDDAFKSFRMVEHHTGGSGSVNASKFNDEFPPIKEIQDDSDSESEAGFDDNFTPSPVQTHANLTTDQGNKSGPISTDQQLQSSPPPSTNTQQSAPPYSQAPGNIESQFSAEFTNLLPSRSDPMKHETSAPGGGSNVVIFQSSTATAPIKDEFDDDAFGDLADAKEVDDKSAENEFGVSSAFGDFDTVFDNPGSKNPAVGMSLDDDGGFADFAFNIESSSQTQTKTDPPALQAPKSASTDDWDNIFASFGEQIATPQTAKGILPANVNGATDQSGTDPGEGGVSLSSSDSASTPAPVGAATTSEGGVIVGSDDEKVTKLTGMGFDRESSMTALEKNGWNIDRAANSLISEG